MTTASAAASVRLALAATVLAVAVAAVLAGRADGAPQAWNTYLAPAATCHGADERGGSASSQQRAIRCLVNWARAQDRQQSLRASRALHRAAVLKGRGVAHCGQLTHTPCNTGMTDAVRRAGYRFSAFGENLFVGSQVTPRDVVASWLASPPHRANILRPTFRELGLAGVSAPGFLGDGASVVWVAAFGSPR